ncbi:hypothetical protein [Marinitoga sp. 1155]|uniref:hypothetical protein n=1 Tax=Marinitoga sp. 1155 TaxID=1428448 RepID=UPI000640D0C4|nr:hypothetical protein [Marinitoga sp. 1155]AJW76971.1 hypothetical protein UF09_5 [Marinitoga camini virus 2]KLO24798.1 hypothetical protein X274_02280 [Marinitoga sp. 1155]
MTKDNFEKIINRFMATRRKLNLEIETLVVFSYVEYNIYETWLKTGKLECVISSTSLREIVRNKEKLELIKRTLREKGFIDYIETSNYSTFYEFGPVFKDLID